MPTVIVDSNQVVSSDWYVKGPAWQELAEHCRAGALQIVVPQVVVKEAVGKFRAKANLALGHLSEIKVPLDVDLLCSQYEDSLRAALSGIGATMPPDVCIDVDTLVHRATMRMKPFNSAGNGFRDTIVWAHAKSRAEAGSQVVLISGDKGFGIDHDGVRRLDADLADELSDPSSVTVFSSIRDYLKSLPLRDGDEPDADTQAAVAAIQAIIDDDVAQVEINVAIALQSATTVVSGRESTVVEIVEVGPLIDIDGVDARPHPDQDGRFRAVLNVFGDVMANVEWSIDEKTSEARRAIDLQGVYMRVGATYDPQTGCLDEFIADPVELDWNHVRNSMMMGSSLPGQLTLLDALLETHGHRTIESLRGQGNFYPSGTDSWARRLARSMSSDAAEAAQVRRRLEKLGETPIRDARKANDEALRDALGLNPTDSSADDPDD